MKIISILMLLLFSELQAQDHTIRELCDEIKLLKDTSGIAMVNCLGAFSSRRVDKLTAGVEDTRVANQMDARVRYNLWIGMEKTCPELNKTSAILLIYPILDLDSIFSGDEVGELADRLNMFWKKKKFNLFVVTIGDYYPYRTIDEFSEFYLELWGAAKSKGATIIVINKKMKEARLLPNQKATKYLSVEESAKLTALLASSSQNDRIYPELLSCVEKIRKKL